MVRVILRRVFHPGVTAALLLRRILRPDAMAESSLVKGNRAGGTAFDDPLRGVGRRRWATRWVLGFCVILAGAAHALIWDDSPPPGGDTQLATGDEGKRIVYRVTALDQDSSTTQSGGPITVHGDPLVELFQRYRTAQMPNGQPHSGTLYWPGNGMSQAAYDPQRGERSYDVSVRLRQVPGREDLIVADPYESGDTRTPGVDPRCDWAGVAPLRTQLNQTVIVRAHKADMKGKVTNAVTGAPITLAEVVVMEADPDPDTEGWTTWAPPTDGDGDYDAPSIYAGRAEVSVSAPGYQLLQSTVTTTANEVKYQNFQLQPSE